MERDFGYFKDMLLKLLNASSENNGDELMRIHGKILTAWNVGRIGLPEKTALSKVFYILLDEWRLHNK